MGREKKRNALRDEETFEEVAQWWSTRFPDMPSRIWKVWKLNKRRASQHGRKPWTSWRSMRALA